MLYAFGSNGSGQLGVRKTGDLSKPGFTSDINSSSRRHINQLAAGGNHTVILFEDGTIKSTGNNEDGRCGDEPSENAHQFSSFIGACRPVDSTGRFLKVKQIAASWSATVILCEDGRLYVCGTGNSGELGLGSNIENAPSWRAISAYPPEGTNVVSIAASMAHTVAVLSNGDVYGWGKGRKGQLGEPAHDVWSPRKIKGIHFAAEKVGCGRDFTAVVGEPSTGQFIVLGANRSDRFGIKASAPMHLTDWTDIAASWGSIYALKASGDVVAWGRNDHGQLPPLGLPKIAGIAAGSEHCLALTKTGKVLAWGWGEHGNCGVPTDENGDVKARWNEIELPEDELPEQEVPSPVFKVFAGCATSFINTDEGSPLVWNSGVRAQSNIP